VSRAKVINRERARAVIQECIEQENLDRMNERDYYR